MSCVLMLSRWTLDRKSLSLPTPGNGFCHFGACSFDTASPPRAGEREGGSAETKMCHLSGDLLGMQKKRLSLWKQQQHSARSTCWLILDNKRNLCMAGVLYRVSMSTSHTSLRAPWHLALQVTVCKCQSCSPRCSPMGRAFCCSDV